MADTIFARGAAPGPDDEARKRRRRINLALLALVAFLFGLAGALRLTRGKARLYAAGGGEVGGLDAPGEPLFGNEEAEPWMKPVADKDGPKGSAAATVDRGNPMRPPAIGQAKSVDGSPLGGGAMFYANRDEKPGRRADAAPEAERAGGEGLKKNVFPKREEAAAARGSFQPTAFGAQPDETPAKDRLPFASGNPVAPVKAQGPVAPAGPVQRAMPVGRSRGWGPGGASGSAGAATSASPGTPGGAQLASGAGAGYGTAEVGAPRTTEGGSGGGSWGDPITGRSTQGGEDPAVKLKQIETVKKIWGMDLSTLYKKLREAGVTPGQMRELEDCLAGLNGCTGGDIWQACLVAKVENSCRKVCAETPGCTLPGGPNPPGGGQDNQCVPEPGCLEAGTMIEVESCGDLALIWSLPNAKCCSCDTSCYSTPDSSPTYGNTGVNCHSSCPAGHYIHRFCSN